MSSSRTSSPKARTQRFQRSNTVSHTGASTGTARTTPKSLRASTGSRSISPAAGPRIRRAQTTDNNAGRSVSPKRLALMRSSSKRSMRGSYQSRSSSWRSRSWRSSSPTTQTMAMAIMHSSNEVIRGATKDIQALLNANDLKQAGKLWKELHRFSKLHSQMEHGVPGVAPGLFQMMDDHVGLAAQKAQLRDQHPMLSTLEQQVHNCLASKKPHLETAQRIFPDYTDFNEHFMLKEEDVLMPAVRTMIEEGRPVKKYICTYMMPILARNNDDLQFFLEFANQILERHENHGPSLRRFNQALWAIATPTQWKEWKVWIQESLFPTNFEQVMREIQAFVDAQKAKQERIQQEQERAVKEQQEKEQALKDASERALKVQQQQQLNVEVEVEVPVVPEKPKWMQAELKNCVEC